MAGWLAGWLVGNCDFNENPVVHLDLDFDLGFVNYLNQNAGPYQKQMSAQCSNALKADINLVIALDIFLILVKFKIYFQSTIS